MRRFLRRLVSRLYNLYNGDREKTLGGSKAIEDFAEPNNGILFMRNPKAEEYLSNSAKTIQNINLQDLARVGQTLAHGLTRGQSPMRTAVDIAGRIDPVTKQRVGGLIALSNYDIGLINIAIHYLQELNISYLKLKLRDKRYDRTVKKSVETKKPIPQERLNRIITAYSNNILMRRAVIIARTETLKSVNYSEYMENSKLVKDGLIPHTIITKEWDDCGDKKVRPSHAIMAEKYGKGKGIPIDEPFVLPSGIKMLYPGDNSFGAPAKEIIQCRCRTHYRVNWLERNE